MFRRARSEAEKAEAVRLALREIHDNLTFTQHSAWAWFALPTQAWAFRSDRQRESLLVGCGGRAGFAGGSSAASACDHAPVPGG